MRRLPDSEILRFGRIDNLYGRKTAQRLGLRLWSCQKDLFDEHERVFGAKRELYEHYINSPREVARLLSPGHERARHIAATVRQRVRDALGLGIL